MYLSHYAKEGPRISTLLLVDGGLLFRNFYALPPMTSPDGRPVNAVYGFMTMLFREIDAIRPSHIAVACDVPIQQNRRVALLPTYKGNRSECPPDLAPQFDLLREVLRAVNIAALGAAGYEADDVMGTMTAKAEACGISVSLLTGDRDVFQLLSPLSQVRYLRKLNAPERYDTARFLQESGISPTLLPDLKGLAGDPSDNLPGIAGIGQKTAVKLLQTFHHLEGVLDSAHQHKGRLRERLESGRQIAHLCKRLATIERSVPDLPTLDACQLALDAQAGRAICEALRFRSLLPRFPA